MAKRVAIATIGTRGDVQPYVALGIALQKSRLLGCAWRIERFFAKWSRNMASNSIRSAAISKTFVKQSQLDEVVSKSLLVNAPQLMRQGQKIVEIAARRSWQMAQGADLLMANMNTTFCIDIAEALDVPVVMSALQPLTATSEFPIVAYDGPDLGPAFNYISHAPMNWQQMFYDLAAQQIAQGADGDAAAQKRRILQRQ